MAENINSYMVFKRKTGIKENKSNSTVWLREVGRKMDFKEIRRECVDWINLALDNGHWQAVVNTVLDFYVPLNSGNFLASFRPSSI
jgi:uncharacterized membrane protein